MRTETGMYKGKEKYIPPHRHVRLPFTYSLSFADTLFFAFMAICAFPCYTYL